MKTFSKIRTAENLCRNKGVFKLNAKFTVLKINIQKLFRNTVFVFLLLCKSFCFSENSAIVSDEPEIEDLTSVQISAENQASAEKEDFVQSDLDLPGAENEESSISADFENSALPFASDLNDSESDSDVAKNTDEYGDDIASIQVEIPSGKKPKEPDSEKLKAAQQKDPDNSEYEEKTNALSFGTPTEINKVVDEIVEAEDPRYSNELYNLFQFTASNDVREKILGYFANQKDPCLEDYAVTILDDPFDMPLAIVQKCMNYVSEVKCKEAAPALIKLIDADDEKYFTMALTALGKTGGAKEALYLAKFLEHDDLETNQRQALMRTLGQMNAVETFDSVMQIAQDEDENSFVRMYAAEAIGNMKKEEAIPVLINLYETGDPNMREYCIKGLQNFPDSKKAKNAIMQAIRDDHVKVRIQAVKAVKEMNMTSAIDFLIYRAKNDSENAVKKECYPTIAALNTDKGNEFLVKQITDKKVPDSAKSMAAEALLKNGNNAGAKEIAELAKSVADDSKRKTLRYSLGKLLAKYMQPAFAETGVLYVQSKDAQTASLGLDMYNAGRYETIKSAVLQLAEDKNRNSSNRKRAQKLLGIEDKEESEEKAPSQKDAGSGTERINSVDAK